MLKIAYLGTVSSIEETFLTFVDGFIEHMGVLNFLPSSQPLWIDKNSFQTCLTSVASHKKSLNTAEKIFEKVCIDGPGEIE